MDEKVEDNNQFLKCCFKQVSCIIVQALNPLVKYRTLWFGLNMCNHDMPTNHDMPINHGCIYSINRKHSYAFSICIIYFEVKIV